ncbi:substrate-binding domain-containing protein [Alcaligenaceae bacterium]|nr:substrate-binding domain-containing protein [Alcaligenaceae bacterium]
MKVRVTIREVAKEAGVSLGTASRALNRTGRVSDKAIAAVTKAARQLGYEPDAVARSMRTRSSGVIGLLVSDLANPLYATIITAAETTFQEAGYALLVASTHNERTREKVLIDAFRGRRVDGIIMGPCETESPELVQRLAKDLPVVALDRDVGPGSTGIQVDHYGGAKQATEYLLNLGHRRIAMLTPGLDLRPGRDRIAGFEAAFQGRGLEPLSKLIRAEKSSMEFAFSDALSLISSEDGPTAFICLGTRILAGVLQAIRHSGRSVPDDISVISIGDTDLSQLFSPAITALRWDLSVVGEVAAQLILKQIDRQHNVEPPEHVRIATQLVFRQSCGPVTLPAMSQQ